MASNSHGRADGEASDSDGSVDGSMGGNRDGPTVEENGSSIDLSRRLLMRASAAAAGLPGLAGVSASASTTQEQRDGKTIEGSTIRAEAFSDNLATAIATSNFNNVITNASFAGANEQATRFDDAVNNGAGLQGYPLEGSEFVVLSSGLAEEAPGDPDTFTSTNIENGRTFNDYSPDGYDAYNVADIEISFQVPEDAKGIAFDYRFASDESPTWLGDEYQDFFEAILFLPDDSFDNIATIGGDAVTLDGAGGNFHPAPSVVHPGDEQDDPTDDGPVADDDVRLQVALDEQLERENPAENERDGAAPGYRPPGDQLDVPFLPVVVAQPRAEPDQQQRQREEYRILEGGRQHRLALDTGVPPHIEQRSEQEQTADDEQAPAVVDPLAQTHTGFIPRVILISEDRRARATARRRRRARRLRAT